MHNITVDVSKIYGTYYCCVGLLGVKRIIMVTITGRGKNKFGNTPLQSNKYNIFKMTKKKIYYHTMYT